LSSYDLLEQRKKGDACLDRSSLFACSSKRASSFSAQDMQEENSKLMEQGKKSERDASAATKTKYNFCLSQTTVLKPPRIW
jgi:hypothetical protein